MMLDNSQRAYMRTCDHRQDLGVNETPINSHTSKHFGSVTIEGILMGWNQ